MRVFGKIVLHADDGEPWAPVFDPQQSDEVVQWLACVAIGEYETFEIAREVCDERLEALMPAKADDDTFQVRRASEELQRSPVEPRIFERRYVQARAIWLRSNGCDYIFCEWEAPAGASPCEG
jgi:hypothetical protein